MTTRASKYEMPTERKMNEILYDLEQNRKAVELDIQVLYEYCKRKYKLLALIKARAVFVGVFRRGNKPSVLPREEKRAERQ